ncbi:MAG: hypothetical protein WKI04_09450 [Ferruginibacter sp.]
MLGENLPHTIQRDKQYYENNQPQVPQILIIQFDRNFLGDSIWQKTEFLPIAGLLKKAARGLQFSGTVADKAASILLNMAEQKGVRRILQLLCVLEEIAFSQEVNYLSSPGFLQHSDERDNKINKVYEFMINNFREDIPLEKIAAHVFLSQSAFCRYFKNKTPKTYSPIPG